MFLNDTFNTISDRPLSHETSNSTIKSNLKTRSSNSKWNQRLIFTESILVSKMAQLKVKFLNCVSQFYGNPHDFNRYLSIRDSLKD